MEIKHVKASEFNNEVLKADKPVLVDFWADWCGPCKMMAPVFHTVADELNGEVDFFSVDVDENPGLAAANKVFSVPTLILYKNGVEASRSVGAISKYDLLDFIEKIK
jgi:thioredoxin 1